MFSKLFHFIVLTVMYLLIQGIACFFVKHGQTGTCIIDTSILESESPKWGKLFFLELSNNCLDPAAQFRFRDNGAMLNLKKQGCLSAFAKRGYGYHLDMFYLYVDAFSLDRSACAQKPDKNIYRAVNQNAWGGLSMYYQGYTKTSFQTWCAVNGHYKPLAENKGIDPYVKLTTPCTDAPNKRFHFGSVTCYGNMTKNANCPKNQYMVVKTASYRGLSATKTCGLSDDYSCEVNVTCLLKAFCDGQHECNITVNDNLFPANSCRGFTRYLYFEYQCGDSPIPYLFLCAPSDPPLNIRTISRSSLSLSLTWDPPAKYKHNGVIISYTACVSRSENGLCFQTFTTNEREWIIRKLNASTRYYIRVLATNKAGNSDYSKSKGFFTNGRAAKKATKVTSSTLTFSLEIPSKTFLYFYVVVLKLKDTKEPTSSSDSYENNDLVTYAQDGNSTNPKPYIAAVITSKNENMFILGDGRNTSYPASRRRRSTSSVYYNGPLDPGTSYIIFQRIFINEEQNLYSTDWSPASKTNEYEGGPRVLSNMSSGDMKAKEGDLINLLCSAQGEPPITFGWEKEHKTLDSLVKVENSHRSSLLVVTMKDEKSFGKYTCHIQDRFQSTTHTIWIKKYTESCEKWLAATVVLVILLVILLIILTYFIYLFRRLKSQSNLEKESKDRNNSNEIYENPDKIKDDGNYEQAEDEQSYTSLKRPGKTIDH